MNMTPTLRSQSDELAELRRLIRDPSSASSRYTDGEIYDAINLALNDWIGRVQIPRYYDVDFTTGTYEYTLPDYIDSSNLDVQFERSIWGLDTSGDAWVGVYTEASAWDVIPASDGGQTLVLYDSFGDSDARILWWGYNGNVPSTIPALETEIDSDDTSLVLDDLVTGIGRCGYVKIDEEWIAYAGYTDDGSNTTLTNLVRGLDGTTAAAHTADSDVEWGIAVPESSLWNQLYNQVGVQLHLLPLTNAAPNEGEHHERILGFHENKVKEFWRNWIPIRPGKMKLSRSGTGEPTY